MKKNWYKQPILLYQKNKNDFKSILVAFALNTQIIKIFTIMSPIIDVFFQGLLFVICLPEILMHKSILKKNVFLLLCFIYISVIGEVSLSYSSGNDKFMMAVKFLFILLTCLSALTFSDYEIKQSIHFYLIINIFYSIVVILHRLPHNEFTYLNLTLSLGCACSIMLNQLFFSKIRIIDLVFLGVFVLAELNFPARGPLIFILLQCFISCFFSKNKKQSFILFISLLGLFLIYLFVIPHNGYSFAYRFLSMFTNHSLEGGERDLLYSTYFSKIKESWFSGYGMGSSPAMLNYIGYYPHNYMLQIWGELGFIAALMILCMTLSLYTKFGIKLIYRKINIIHVELIFIISYFEFQFLKSFDMLSTYPLWIFFVFLLISLNEGVVKDGQQISISYYSNI